MPITTNIIREIRRTNIALGLQDGKIIAEPASALTPRQREQIREHRAEIILELQKDEILKKALDYLFANRMRYIPLDVEEDIETSYRDDDLPAFKETVRGWIRELVA